MRERWLAIVNPAAGRGAAERLAPDLAAKFADAGLRVDVTRSPAQGEGARLARAAAEDGYAAVVAVGGDGTVNEIAHGLIGSGTALGVYPVGVGNDVARNLGYPRRRREIPRFLASARRRTIDAGEANGRLFVNHVGIGIDGVVAERARSHARRIGARLGYFTASIQAIASYRPTTMRLVLDGVEERGRFLMVAACNGVHFGGGMKPAPAARLDDGWLDVVIARDLTVRQSILALLRLYRGTHEDGVRVVVRRARSLDVELEHALPMEADGEVSRVRRLKVRVRPAALVVLAS